MKKMMLTVAGITLMGSSTFASAEVGVGFGVKASTLGAGVELGFPVSESFVVRGALNKYSRDEGQIIDDIHYDVELDLKSTALFLDWHPMQGSFHLTAGYLFNGSDLTGTARPAGTFTVGNTTLDGSVYPVQLNTSVDLGSGPYLGLGWGNLPAKGFGFSFELGAVQQGVPDVTLTKSGDNLNLISNQDVALEQQRMQDDLDEFELYPVISLGISYGF